MRGRSKNVKFTAGKSVSAGLPFTNSDKAAADKEVGKVGGEKSKVRLDRASGGRANATSAPMAPASSSHPFSSAHQAAAQLKGGGQMSDRDMETLRNSMPNKRHGGMCKK